MANLLADGALVNEKDTASGNWPVIITAYKGYDEILESLLQQDADLTILDPGMNATALHAAAYAGRSKAAMMLIQHGIVINQ